MKKKFLSLVLAICLIIPGIVMLSACGKTGPAGVYSVSSVTTVMDGSTEAQTFTVEDYNTAKAALEQNPDDMVNGMIVMMLTMFFEMDLTVNEDGTFTMTIDVMGEEETMSGTWTQEGDTLSLTGGEETATATYKNNTLTMTEPESESTVVFSKN